MYYLDFLIHICYIHIPLNFQAPESVETIMTEHLKMNAIYWGLSVLDLLDSLPTKEFSDKIKDFVISCQNSDGMFLRVDKHILHLS